MKLFIDTSILGSTQNIMTPVNDANDKINKIPPTSCFTTTDVVLIMSASHNGMKY